MSDFKRFLKSFIDENPEKREILSKKKRTCGEVGKSPMKHALLALLIGCLPALLQAQTLRVSPVRGLPFTEGICAIATGSGKCIAVGEAGSIYSSTDGLLWTRKGSVVRTNLYAAAWTGSLFCAAGNNGVILTSSDGEAWIVQASGTTINFGVVLSGNGLLLAAGDAGKIFTSPDGTTWTLRSTPVLDRINGLSFGGGTFVAVTEAGGILTSPDATTWTSQTSPATGALSAIAYSNGLFVAVGGSGEVLTSSDGTAWTILRTGQMERLWAVVVTATGFAACGSGGVVLTSTNGVSWTSQTLTGNPRLRSIAEISSTRITVSDTGQLWTSANGSAWTLQSSGASADLCAAASNGAGTFVAVGTGGVILYSLDGDSWTAATSPVTKDLAGITFAESKFLAVGAAGSIVTSQNGQLWSSIASGTSAALHGITGGTSGFVAVGEGGLVLHSANGTSWSSTTIPGAKGALLAVAFGNGIYIAVGQWGQIATSPDGQTWTLLPEEPTQKERWYDITGIAFSNGRFILSTHYSTSFTSTDGITWTKRTAAMVPGQDFCGAVALASSFAVFGDRGTIETSPDGLTWTNQARSSGGRLRSGVFSNGTLILVGDNGAIIHAVVPTITVLIGSSSVQPGGAATLSVTATGNGTLTYQWFSGASGNTSLPVSGATFASFTTPSLAVTTSYWMRVTDSNGSSEDSPTITIAVRGIGTQPQITAVTLGNSGTLSVTAGGIGTLRYQWYLGVAGDTSSPVAGATSSSLSIIPAASGASYWVRVSDDLGSFDSTAAAILVRQTNWTAYHAGWAATGDAANTTTGATKDLVQALKKSTDGTSAGNATIKYSWTGTYTSRTDNKTGWAASTDAYSVFNGFVGLGSQGDNVASAGNSTITLSGLDATKLYELVVYAGRDSTLFAATNLNAYVLQNASVLSTSHSTGVTGAGSNASVAVGLGCRAAGRVARWTFQPAGSSVVLQTTAGGAAANSIIPQAIRLVELTESPVITASPVSTSLAVGSNVTLTTTILGTGLSYQWYRRDVLGNLTEISGAVSPSLNLTGIQESAQYYVRAIGSGGNIDSAPATILALRSYEQWASFKGIVSSVETDDDDGDGLPNLVEYALGTEPNQQTTSPSLSIDGEGVLALTFRISKESDGVMITPETSTNLASDSWTSPTLVQLPDANFATQMWVASVPITNSRAFLRLRVSRF